MDRATLIKSPDYELRHVDTETGFGLLTSVSQRGSVILDPIGLAIWRTPSRSVDKQLAAAAFSEVFASDGGNGYFEKLIFSLVERGILLRSGEVGTEEDHRALQTHATTPSLKHLNIYYTWACNCHCYHCYQHTIPSLERRFADIPGELAAEDYAMFAGEAKHLGLTHVKITGGEPLLRRDFPKLLDGLLHLGVRVSLETNAFYIDKAMAQLLAEANVHVSISLDGDTPDLHDTLRGLPGAFERATNAMTFLAAEGCSPSVMIAVSHTNLDAVLAALRLAHARGCRSGRLNFLSTMGAASALSDTSVPLDISEIVEVHGRRDELEEKSGLRISMNGPPSLASVYELGMGIAGTCTFTDLLGILPDGTLSFCGADSFTTSPLGNIADKEFDLAAFWETEPALVAARREVTHRETGLCGNCLLAGAYCRGACPAWTFERSGNLSGPHQWCEQAYEEGLFPEYYLT